MRRVALAMALTLLLGGCMPSVRLNDRAVVRAVGIDLLEDGSYRATMQVGEVAGASAGTNRPENAGKELIIEETGRTMTDLFTRASVHQGKQLFLGSGKILLIGEETARNGVSDLLGFFNANNQIPPTLAVVVTRGEAGALIRAGEREEVFTADGMLDVLSSAQKSGYAPQSRLMDIVGALAGENVSGKLAVLAMREVETGGKEPPEAEQAVSRAETEKSGASEQSGGEQKQSRQLVAAGTAIFRGDKLSAGLDAGETRGFCWLGKQLQATPLVVRDDALGVVSAATHSQRAKIGVEALGDNLVFEIEAWVRSTAYEANLGGGRTFGDEERAYAERLQEKLIREEIEAALARTEKAGLDALALSRLVRQRYPELYQAHRGDWRGILEASGFEVTVHCRIDRTGAGNRKM